jgi:selenocysteine lyase/cysteine desulfurase
MQTANLSLNLNGVHPAEVARVLETEFEIMVRAGLHCSPSAHKILGTYPDGTVRLSLGYFHTLKEVDEIIRALEMIIQLIGHSKGQKI